MSQSKLDSISRGKKKGRCLASSSLSKRLKRSGGRGKKDRRPRPLPAAVGGGKKERVFLEKIKGSSLEKEAKDLV